MSAPSPSSKRMTAKAEEIRRVLSEPTVDLWKLRELALTEGGLVNDSLRKLAWPKLVGVDPTAAAPSRTISIGSGITNKVTKTNNATTANSNTSIIPPSLDAEQIERDVSRVTWHLLTGNQRSRNFQMKNKHRKRIAQLLKRKQRRLGDFLNLVLVWSYCEEEEGEDWGENDVGANGEGVNEKSVEGGYEFITTNIVEESEEERRLRYYQGYHDIASIVLSALGGASSPLPPPTTSDDSDQSLADLASSMGLTLASQVLHRLSRSHLRDALRSNFINLQSALRLIIMPLLGAFDAELHSHLVDCDMEPFFCLSWIITWFAHDVRDTALVKRLYDFFLVSHPLMSVYMSVAMMIHPLNRIEVLGADCDFACVHHALADLPKNSSNVGWKYLPGEQSGSTGYVTGEEEDGDERSYDASLQDQSLDEEDDGSVTSGAFGIDGRNGSKARVPFQELIDLSVSLMHKIPPRNLINLARRYHAEITLKPLMAQASTIALLQPPPAWGLASFAASDWVLKQKIREEYGMTKLNRHQRKNRRKQQQQEVGETTALEKRRRPPSTQAVIASGTGPDGLSEARIMRKKRRMLVRSIAVVVLSVFIALVKDYFSQQPAAASAVSAATVSHSSRPQQAQQKRQVTRGEDLSNKDGMAPQPNAVTVNTNKKDKPSNIVEGEAVQTRRKDSSKKNQDVSENGAVEDVKTPLQKKKQTNNVCDDDESDGKQSLSYVEEPTAQVQSIKKSHAPTEDGHNDEVGVPEKEEVSSCITAQSLSADDEPNVVTVDTTEEDDKSSTIVISTEEEGESVQVQRKETSEKKSPSLSEGVKEHIKAPPRKKKQINNVCDNDESCVTSTQVDEKQSSSSVNESTPHVQNGERSPVSSEDGENYEVDAPRKEPISVHPNDDAATVLELSLLLPSQIEEKIVEQQQPSCSAREDIHDVLMRHSMLAAKKTLTTIQNQTLELHLDQLEQRIDLLLMRLMDTSKATWSKIAPVLMRTLRIGWRQIIIKAEWLNRIVVPVLKEELAAELEGEPPEWAEDVMEMWKKQDVLLRNRRKLIGKLARAGKESLSKKN